MHQSILLTDGNREDRLAYAQELLRKKNIHREDITQISGDMTIGIEEIRKIIHLSALLPLRSAYRGTIVHPGELLTVESQNALLKTLEEPPSRLILILTAPSVEHVLPTIASRCTVVNLSSQSEETNILSPVYEKVFSLKSAPIGDKLQLAFAMEQVKERKKIIEELDLLIAQTRRLLLKEYQLPKQSNISAAEYASLIDSLLLCRAALKANVGPRLALEYLVLHATLSQASEFTPKISPS